LNKLLKKSIYFIIPMSVFILFGVFYFTCFQKGDAVIWFNNHHSEFRDVFFKYATYLGDGVFIGIIILLFLMFKPYWFVQLLTATLANTLVIYVLKREVFNYDRPLRVLSHIKPVAIDGVEIHEIYSFPSGHTDTAFLLAFVLTLLLVNKKWGIVLFFLALSAAVSRMYLFQHFFMDVYVGALIGVFVSMITFYLIDKLSLKNKKRLNQPFWGIGEKLA